MKIANITNYNFKGIKVKNPELNKRNDKSANYQKDLQEIDTLIKYAQKMSDDTIEDKKAAIEKKYEGIFSDRITEINSKARKSLFTRIFRTAKIDEAKKELDAQKYAELSKLGNENTFADKERVVSIAEEKFNDVKRRILTNDMLNIYRWIKKNTYADEATKNITDKLKKGDFSSIAGYEYEKQVLDNVFVFEVAKEKKGQEADVVGSVLFFGPWNNGKTHISKSVAGEAGCRFVEYKSLNSKDFIPQLDKIAKEAQEYFEETGERTVLFIDELDRFVSVNASSYILSAFARFIKTCSEKSHVTLFAATNNPERLGLDMDNNDIFPIRMSIDVPNNENLKSMLEFYFEDVAKSDVDYDELVKHIREIEKMSNCRYSNGQIGLLFESIVEKYNKATLSQEEITDFIHSHTVEPDIDEEDLLNYQKQYKLIMGG